LSLCQKNPDTKRCWKTRRFRDAPHAKLEHGLGRTNFREPVQKSVFQRALSGLVQTHSCRFQVPAGHFEHGQQYLACYEHVDGAVILACKDEALLPVCPRVLKIVPLVVDTRQTLIRHADVRLGMFA